MTAACCLINANIVNIKCLEVLQKSVALYLDDLTEGVSQHLSGIAVNEYGAAFIIEQLCKLLLVIFGGVGFEQVGALLIMHHVYLMKELHNLGYVALACFADHF